MRREKIIAQLESQRASIRAALKDESVDYTDVDDPAFFHGYWVGALYHNTEALTLLKGKELES